MPTALIIGASSGIGREIATQLAARGFRLGIAARNAKALAELSRILGPDHCVFEPFDIASTEAACGGFHRLCATLSDVDYVYLVAGTGFPNPTLDPALEEETVRVNCLGFAALAAEAMRLFRAQGRGHLVAITSVAAVRPSGQAPAYGASKAFASTYLEALRYWILQNKLPVFLTEIRPGFVDTAMLKAEKPFWVVSPQQAAADILKAVDRKKAMAYVPARWKWVALFLRFLPDGLYAKMG
jgi:short-subunit dehydrogenase